MNPSQIDPAIAELESRLERLRVLYEQYFMGLEKRPPEIPRKDVERRAQDLRKVRFQNTASRFKFQTIIQRYNTLQQYWNRTCRDIENGTYRRHVLRAERRFASVPPPDAPREETRERARGAADATDRTQEDLASMLDGDVDVAKEMSDALAEVAKEPADKTVGGKLGKLGKLGRSEGGEHVAPTLTLGKAPPRPAAPSGASPQAKQPPPAPSMRPKAQPRPASPGPAPLPQKPPPRQQPTPGGPSPKPAPKPAPAPQMQPARAAPAAASSLSEDRIRAIHQSYLDARKKTNATAVSFEKLERSIRETERKLREKSKGRSVDFDVSIKEGKAILKPRLK